MKLTSFTTKALRSRPSASLPQRTSSRVVGRGPLRLLATLHGRSGREYAQEEAPWPQRPGKALSLARYDGRQYVAKRVQPERFELLQEMKIEFGHERHLRTHIDEDEAKNVLIYECFRDDLLQFICRTPDLDLRARKQILRGVGQAMRALHSKNWIHLDLKPDNIFLDWRMGPQNEYVIERVVLGDLDMSLHLRGSKLFNHRVGNVMWRSPEGQAGKAIGKPSEIFSYGLVCLFTISGHQFFLPCFEDLKELGLSPEYTIAHRLLMVFGPAPPELLTHIDDDEWHQVYTFLSDAVEANELKRDPDDSQRLENLPHGMFPNMNRKSINFILRMTQLDPGKRATIDEILEDSWWNEET